jgi:glycosyltransferase involved in cell wall biosynthesis
VPQPLRVALDATSLYDPLSGVGRFVREVLAVAAPRPGLEVSAYAITFRGRERLIDLVPDGVQVHPTTIPMAATPLRLAWRHADRPRVDRWIGSPDVVHGTNFVVPPTAGGAVVTIHDLTYLRFPEMCTGVVLEYPVLVERALARGAVVHTVSDFVRAEVLERYGLPEDRVVAVPNGVTASAPGDERAGHALAGGARYIAAVGTVEPRKDLPGLVAAFDLVAADDPALRLVIAGADGWGADALTVAIERSPHAARIVRTGWISEADRADLLAGSLSLVLPSRYEGFGLPALEAMAAGTPVIATAVGALPEVVGGAARLVPGADVEELAGAISAVVGSADLRADLRARGRARAASFSWDRTVDGLASVWATAAGR